MAPVGGKAKIAFQIPHGINWISILIVILLIWGIRWGYIVTPQIRATANKVVQLNNLQDVNMKIGGCIPIKGSL